MVSLWTGMQRLATMLASQHSLAMKYCSVLTHNSCERTQVHVNHKTNRLM